MRNANQYSFAYYKCPINNCLLTSLSKQFSLNLPSAYLPSLTTEQVKTEDNLPPLMLHSDSVTSNKLFVDDDMYCHVHGGLVIGMCNLVLSCSIIE